MSVAQRGHDLVFGERQNDYGDPAANLSAIADFWSSYLTRRNKQQIVVDTTDVCAMMRLLKEARLMHDPGHKDSLVDLCGYAILQDLVSNHGDPLATSIQARGK